MKIKIFLKRIEFIYFLNDFYERIKHQIFYSFLFKYGKFSHDTIHFLHVPRCGTTALVYALRKTLLSKKIESYNHYVKCFFLGKKNRYIISIRNPINRFYSAFYHTKFRQPITYRPKELFKQFPNASDLAESIYSNDKKLRKRAVKALKYTHFFRESLITFIDKNTFLNNKPFYIFEVENLQKDINGFCKKTKIPKVDVPPESVIWKKKGKNLGGKYFRTKKHFTPALSKKSIRNLSIYLKKEIKLYQLILKHKRKINNR